MMPKQPPKKTATRPGLGEDGIPRMDSAELKKVRVSDKPADSSPTPPPSSRAARVPREDEDENGPVSMPRSDQFIVASKKNTAPQSFKPMNPPPQGRLGQTSTTPQAFKPVGAPSNRPAPASSRPAPAASRPAAMNTAPSSFKPVPPPQNAAKTTGKWGDEAVTGQRARKPVTIDAVGDAATRIARTTRQTSPKVVASAATIASAPLDSRSAFVLSLVDGTSSVPAIVDASGLAEDEVIGILARLARLGLISVP